MGEPAAAQPAAARDERDVLLATKLNVPGLRPDLVPRPRLAQRLDEGRGRGLVLACAPAGYGKTVLLAEWVRRVRHPVAWLSLDAADNDPARFWRHAVAALDRVRPGISERMGPLLGPPPPPSFEPLVTALINAVAGQPDADEALLILDDYHVISSRLVHESLGFLDYLAEEVLERQSEQVRSFLLETSILERLSGELCDTVTGRPGSQALLEEAERAGLFVVPLDEVRGWWRYHHLFADLLRARLQQQQPTRIPALHRNAAAWYAERGLADDAIRHAVAAGEMTWAARLIEQHFDAVHSLCGEAATVQRWFAPLPADLVRSRPRLLLAQAVPAATGGRLEAAEQLVDAAERAYAGQGAGTGEEPFGASSARPTAPRPSPAPASSA
jgi:ATP/maltotriose-dependent transcriptional regulator MalT